MKGLLLLMLLIFISCEKSEIPILPHNPGDILINQIELSTDYRFQVFYDLGTNMKISQNIKTDWDLQFESSSEGFHILINSSTFSAVSYVNDVPFSDNLNPADLIWSWDNANGDLDSTAFGDHRIKTGFYILDRGYNMNASPRGYKKILIDTVNTEYYQISYSNLDNSDFNSVKIYKDQDVSFTSFSFEQNNTVSIQPPIDDWDLIFTQYTHLFNDTITPAYLVTGVLSNYNVLVAQDTVYDFEDITYDMISNFLFSNDCNIIGYDWKEYSFDSGAFTINSLITYIIKDRQERYFKLRFLDFYNDIGEKGYPKFEIQEL